MQPESFDSIPNVSGVSGKYINIDNTACVLDSTAHIIKLAIKKYNPIPGSRRAFVFHSWRAIVQGQDAPLDSSEIAFFREYCPVDLFLVANEQHCQTINMLLDKPSIVAPYSAFIPSDPFIYRSSKQEFDVVFFCMFWESQIKRKNADLFLEILRADPSLRGLWIGDYSSYERWCMENAFNSIFTSGEPAPYQWSSPWTENEYIDFWYYGGGLFPSEAEDLQVYEHYLSLTRKENLNLTLYRGLSRNQVAHALSRSRSVVVLSSLDLWPRCMTESLASGLPVVALDNLISGLEILNEKNSIIVSSPNAQIIAEAIRASHSLNRQYISDDFYQKYGLIRCSRLVMQTLDKLGISWSEIVDWQRPLELLMKQGTRLYRS